jgi:transposase
MRKKSNRFSPEVRERAVRMVFENRGEYALWATIESVAAQFGRVPQTLNNGVRQQKFCGHAAQQGGFDVFQ